MAKQDLFKTRTKFDTGSGQAYMYSLKKLSEIGYKNIEKLPFSIKVLLESVLRECDGYVVTENDVKKLAEYDPANPIAAEIPFKPARVILQDFTGVPAVVDLASLRTAMANMGGDPQKINPRVPVNLVVDHSVMVDYYGSDDAFEKNKEIEFKRNKERYEFLRWGQKAFDNFHVVPPASGIVHQVNLEYIAKGVWTRSEGDEKVVYPDSLVGTDSHTTMINGLGILGWGVGGIEAEAVMLDQPIYMLIPEVIGFKLTGKLKEGVTATDMTLTIVQMLREKGVVGKFVEFYGSGLDHMTLPDRAMVSNMAPEYGATIGFFPIDAESLNYLRKTGRSEENVKMVEEYTKLQGLFRTSDSPDPVFTDTLELDISTVEPSLAGPKRPQDRINLNNMKSSFRESLTSKSRTGGFSLSEDKLDNKGVYVIGSQNDSVQKVNDSLSKGYSKEEIEIRHGDVMIAAITSCTNTSNPSVLLAAGILAKKAVKKGLSVQPYVKTSLAPGSKVVTEYLDEAGLTDYLNELGFNTVGYGCTTCIGNSGPLDINLEKTIVDNELVVAGVLSGNRNFEGRIHQNVKANYLASPPLVVAYAIAGTIDINLRSDSLGKDKDGNEVYLKDLWPTSEEINEYIDMAMKPELFNKIYDGISDSNDDWNKIPVSEGDLFEWNNSSTYIQNPPFFENLTGNLKISPISNANVLVKVGDSITTDHISPAGAIKADTPAGKYLLDNNVEKLDFNSYGSRRGNDKVMTRGTFANIRLRNQLAPGTEGGYTTYIPSNEVEFIYDASMKYQESETPLIVLAGKEYGTGSSRDWAAKGTYLLGIKAVIAESFERIHRSNLVGMGVLPLQFNSGDTAESLGLSGFEKFDIHIDDNLTASQDVTVIAKKADGTEVKFITKCRIDTPVEVDYYRNGGILQTVLLNFLEESK